MSMFTASQRYPTTPSAGGRSANNTPSRNNAKRGRGPEGNPFSPQVPAAAPTTTIVPSSGTFSGILESLDLESQPHLYFSELHTETTRNTNLEFLSSQGGGNNDVMSRSIFDKATTARHAATLFREALDAAKAAHSRHIQLLQEKGLNLDATEEEFGAIEEYFQTVESIRAVQSIPFHEHNLTTLKALCGSIEFETTELKEIGKMCGITDIQDVQQVGDKTLLTEFLRIANKKGLGGNKKWKDHMKELNSKGLFHNVSLTRVLYQHAMSKESAQILMCMYLGVDNCFEDRPSLNHKIEIQYNKETGDGSYWRINATQPSSTPQGARRTTSYTSASPSSNVYRSLNNSFGLDSPSHIGGVPQARTEDVAGLPGSFHQGTGSFRDARGGRRPPTPSSATRRTPSSRRTPTSANRGVAPPSNSSSYQGPTDMEM